MSRLYAKYDDKNPPIDCYLSASKWFNNSGSQNFKGLLFHDTSADNTYIHRYDVPLESDPKYGELIQLLGRNPNNNDWNHGGKDKDAGVNAFIGTIADGKTVTSVVTAPYNKAPWGCGSGRFGSLNSSHWQFEICQDNRKNVDYFADVYEEAIQLCAYVAKKFHIDPHGTFTQKGYTIPNICCHWDAYLIGWNGIPIYKPGSRGGFGSGHTDIYDWNALYDYMGLSMKEIYGDPYKINPLDNPVFNRIRKDIEKAMAVDPSLDGWVRQDGKWYYYDKGVMIKSDWIKWRGSWYYMGKDGTMVTDFQTVDGKIYHFDNTGAMAQGEWWGKYFADMSGVCSDRGGKFVDDNRGTWFTDSTGWYPKDSAVMIDGESYEFDAKGYLIA